MIPQLVLGLQVHATMTGSLLMKETYITFIKNNRSNLIRRDFVEFILCVPSATHTHVDVRK